MKRVHVYVREAQPCQAVVEIRSQVESMSVGEDGVHLVLRSRKEGGAKPGEILAHILGLDEETRSSLRVIKTACDLGPP